tara:strand:+ start:667 stop:780 length:114 start_codon:yes stop_codon:yes gene_type:complete
MFPEGYDDMTDDEKKLVLATMIAEALNGLVVHPREPR